jgi:hypothetical protein
VTLPPSLQADDVVEKLGLHRRDWIDDLEAVGPGDAPLAVPKAAECRDLLSSIGVSEADASDVVSSLPSPDKSPEWWWLLERAVHRLTLEMGDPDKSHFGWPHWVASKPGVALERRCFMAHVYLATLPYTRAWHQAHGVPDDISWSSLADLGRHMAIHRRMYGEAGVDASWWLSLSLRGEVFDLGRLQFTYFRLGYGDQSPPWYSPEDVARLGEGFAEGDSCIGVHIPESGPMTPEACEESFRTAAGFFAKCFPVPQGRRLATCWSWLLDDQLSRWLSPASNIMAFQRRFELVPGSIESDWNILDFVFRKPMPAGGWTPEWLDSLPARSTLERAIVAHLRAGGHWRSRTGWLDLG